MLMVPPAAVLPAGWPLVPGAVDAPPPRMLHAENATAAMAARAPRRRSGLLDLLTNSPPGVPPARRLVDPSGACSGVSLPIVEIAVRSRMMRHRGKRRESQPAAILRRGRFVPAPCVIRSSMIPRSTIENAAARPLP